MQAVTVSISQLQGLLCDVWAALRLLVVGPQAGFGQSVELSTVAAAAAAAAATAGHSLLLGLAAVGVGLCTEAEDEEEEDGGGGGGWSDLQGDVESECWLFEREGGCDGAGVGVLWVGCLLACPVAASVRRQDLWNTKTRG